MDADERERASGPTRIGAVFRGFLVLRFLGLIALVVVAAVVLGIRSLARGSDVVGVAVLVGAAVVAGAVGGLVVRGAGRRR
ncbi:MAG TPA: hypothetical protein VFR49_07050 [Solirubrobacteraceae bacterium]|nr:hypothetical protein [Solirubrobacteraceae bacterium]